MSLCACGGALPRGISRSVSLARDMLRTLPMDWRRLARSRGVLSIVLALSISALVAGWIYAIGGPSELR